MQETLAPSPFDLPAETLDQAVTKVQAILQYWHGPGGKPWRDELDACYAVACGPTTRINDSRRWASGLRWGQLVAMVKGQPVPVE